MNKLKFCANISMMFVEQEPCLLKRYKNAKLCGFKGVELWFPYDIPVDEIKQAKEDVKLEQILINSYPGDTKLGECGLAALPGREEDFRKAMDLTISYAEALDCKRIHIMSGKLDPAARLANEQSQCLQTLEKNLRFVLPELEKRNIVGLIEPINNQTVPGYILNNFDLGMFHQISRPNSILSLAVSIVKSINSPYIRIMMDFFHLQQIHGNLTQRIVETLPYTGHIQIAQVPGRNEPNTPGEIDYQYVLNTLAEKNYDGWIGLEYKAKEKTETGLKWMDKFFCIL